VTNSTALSGRSILVTRPTEQAERLSRSIRAAGGIPFEFPTIEIKPPTDPARLEEILARLEHFDLAIFISPTAVARTWDRVAGARSWPETLAVAAVGQGSARALSERGFQEVIAPPDQSDSEALLALPALLEVAGKRVVIFRGEGGRELLAQTLTQRGATVEHAECYRRARPDVDIAPLLRQHEHHKFAAIILTSRESLANLRAMLGTAWDLFKTVPVFVSHERIADAAREQGMNSVHVAPGGNAGIMQAMIKFFQS
jgi:uroporphyrinogen-III synthase